MHARTLLIVATVLVAVATGPALAHGWGVEVDDQVVGDDTVVVRTLFVLEPSWIAVHRVADDGPGESIGHVRIDHHGEFENLAIDLADGALAGESGVVRLVAVVHGADGDGTFDWPDGDPIYRPDDPVTDRFDVSPSDDGSARLVANRQTTEGNLTVARVDLPADGFLVLYEETDDGSRGDVVGVRPLSAGHHENVTVPIDHRFYNAERTSVYVVAGIHRDDGDGTFDRDADDPFTVNGSALTVAFDAEKERFDLPTESPTASPTADPTPSPSSPGAAATETHKTDTPTLTPPTEMPGQPGFGFGAAVVALVALALLARRRRATDVTRR